MAAENIDITKVMRLDINVFSVCLTWLNNMQTDVTLRTSWIHANFTPETQNLKLISENA